MFSLIQPGANSTINQLDGANISSGYAFASNLQQDNQIKKGQESSLYDRSDLFVSGQKIQGGHN